MGCVGCLVIDCVGGLICGFQLGGLFLCLVSFVLFGIWRFVGLICVCCCVGLVYCGLALKIALLVC